MPKEKLWQGYGRLLFLKHSRRAAPDHHPKEKVSVSRGWGSSLPLGGEKELVGERAAHRHHRQR